MWEIYEHRKAVKQLESLPTDVLKRYEKWVSLNWIQAAIASGFKPASYSASNIGLAVRI